MYNIKYEYKFFLYKIHGEYIKYKYNVKSEFNHKK